MDVLSTIKRLVLRGNVLFTRKARDEMDRDDLDEAQVCEAIMNSPTIAKRIRSIDPESGQKEYLYILIGVTFDGLVIYTKEKIQKKNGREIFYVFISSKKSTA